MQLEEEMNKKFSHGETHKLVAQILELLYGKADFYKNTALDGYKTTSPVKNLSQTTMVYMICQEMFGNGC